MIKKCIFASSEEKVYFCPEKPTKSMKPELIAVNTRRQLREFIEFPVRLYKDEPNYVPALYSDEIEALTDKNPASPFCEKILYLARIDGKTVGRVAGIINNKANAKWGENVVRFGWIDFINDIDVAGALIGAVAEWGKAKGMVKIKGPLGFTDMDKEGMLVEGFENLSPFTCIYNFAYYPELLEKLGFTKDVDWTQKVMEIPTELPAMYSYCSLIENRFKVKIFQARSSRELMRTKGRALFHVLNDSFAPLYEFSKLSEDQIDRYLQQYGPAVNKDFVCVAENEKGELVGFMITIPCISRHVRKSHGHLFPFGWYHILRGFALKDVDELEALMVGVLPEYQGAGIPLLLAKYIHESCLRHGIKRILMNPQLEENYKVQSAFNQYKTEPYMRRRSYTKDL